MARPKKLPRPSDLRIEQTKVQDYLLNLSHKDGRSKAQFFRNRGFKSENWQIMADALRQHGATQTVVETSTSRFGRKFMVECQVQTPDGKNPCILTVWIQAGREPPRLVTAHPNRSGA